MSDIDEATITAVATVADLTEGHIGWQIRVAEPGELIDRRYLVLGAIRRWEYQGVMRVGLLDTSTAEGRFIGTEWAYPADRACSLVRPVRKPRRRVR